MKKSMFLLLVFCAIFSLAGKEPKYIFLFIGDGMAIAQRMVAEEFYRKTGQGKLAMNSLPVHAMTKTFSANQLVTDSAAAATAIACGSKTNNGMIGIAPDGTRLTSVAEVARDRGKKVGIITSVTLNHATPSGFYGHRRNRGEYYNLGKDLVASGFDFFGGGGIANYDQQQPDILSLAKENGYTVVRGKEGLLSLRRGQKAIAFAAGLNTAMPYAIEGNKAIPTLAEITAKAINLLDNPDGFFIMVEGGAIDWAGHSNEAAPNLFELIALDKAVSVALEFYKQHPQDTLIVVTGDHETGGMTMGFAGTGANLHLELLAKQKCTNSSFSLALKKIKEKEPDMTFDDVKPLLTSLFGFEFSGDSIMRINEKELKTLEDGYKAGKLFSAARLVLDRKAGVGWTTGNHTAQPVLTTCIGPGSELFAGFIDNTDISLKLKSLL